MHCMAASMAHDRLAVAYVTCMLFVVYKASPHGCYVNGLVAWSAVTHPLDVPGDPEVVEGLSDGDGEQRVGQDVARVQRRHHGAQARHAVHLWQAGRHEGGREEWRPRHTQQAGDLGAGNVLPPPAYVGQVLVVVDRDAPRPHGPG